MKIKHRSELTLVMPVYNEEACIFKVIQSWHDALSALKIDFTIIVLNDGSTDETATILHQFVNNRCFQIIHKKNSGHGPTILDGYKKAVHLSEWVFHVDSDDEISPEYFHELWSRRHDYDALFGARTNRNQIIWRKLISEISRISVHLKFGKGVKDVNTPYRLIRSSVLKEFIRIIPTNTFAPNVIISGMLVRSHSRIYNLPVRHEGRKTGSVSIVKWNLWKGAVRSFIQTITFNEKQNSTN